jgi:hypothetical protein
VNYLSCLLRVSYRLALLQSLLINSLRNVEWRCDIYFCAVNGAEQSAVPSPVLFSAYLDGTLIALSEAGVECFIGSTFVGALANADDIVLTAPIAMCILLTLLINLHAVTEFPSRLVK